MFQHMGWWLPDGEKYLVEILDHFGGKYQQKHRTSALGYVDGFRTAVDIGAHVGLWACELAERFNRVICIEPIQEHIDCLQSNLTQRGLASKVLVIKTALGKHIDSHFAMAEESESSSDYHVCSISDPVDRTVKSTSLDNLALSEVDFIKIDCEGFELPILVGGFETIIGNEPTINIEQKPHPHFEKQWGQYAALDYLKGLGMVEMAKTSDDFVLSFVKGE